MSRSNVAVRDTLVIAQTYWLAKPLRVTDSRSGARLCEPQQGSLFKRIQFIAEALWLAKLLAAADAPSGGLRKLLCLLSISVVSQPFKPRRPAPPHNPGLRELVLGKRHGSSPPKIEDLERGFRGWHERGYLPHRDEPGLKQFVTFRLADSFPETLRSEWEHLWHIEDDHKRRAQLELYLDKGRGECHLRRIEIARLVEDNFR